MRRSNIAASLCLLGLAVFILLQARPLGFGSIRAPQTGFFPSLLACLLLIGSLVLLGQALRQSATIATLWTITAEGWKRIGVVFLVLITFAVSLETLGYLISTFLLMAVLLRAIEPQRWNVVIAMALAAALGSYLIFATFLNVPLPRGFLGI
jgi:putative tricarboxylic transport membrane protein